MTSKPATNLALDSGAAEDASVVDALPYIDGITADERHQADELIKEELKRSNKKPSDYLAKFAPMPPTTFQGHSLLQHEYDRVKAGKPLEPLDTSRFHLEPPPASKQNDFSAWRQATDNAHSQLEHQYNRLLNLELLLRYGSNARRRHNQSLEGHVRRLELHIQKLSEQRDSINKQRKLTQEADGRTLKQLEQQYKALVTKNMEINMACQELESSVGQLQEELGHRDDTPDTQMVDADAPEPAPKDAAAGEVEVEYS